MGGFIVAYQGLIENIPPYFIICNGNSGTPDLRNRFCRGAYSDLTRPSGTVGGNATHTHEPDSSPFSHSHTVNNAMLHQHGGTTSGDNLQQNVGDLGADASKQHNHSLTAGGEVHTHNLTEGSNIPRYYKLLFLMCQNKAIDVPVGAIMMWTGSINDVPSGYAFCNGNNGTPDLRDRFIRGAYSDQERPTGSTGGGESHSHIAIASEHSHTMESAGSSHYHRRSANSGGGPFPYDDVRLISAGSSHIHSIASSGSHTHEISEATNILPPFYNLAYLKRIQ